MQKYITKILEEANQGEKHLKIYTNFWGLHSESHLKQMEHLGFAEFMKVGFKGNEFYIIKYNEKELKYMGIDIYSEDFYNGLKFVMEKHNDRISEIKNRIAVTDEIKLKLSTYKNTDQLNGYHIGYFLDNETIREFYLVETPDKEQYVVMNDGFVAYYDAMLEVMREIYGKELYALIRRETNSHLLAVCRIKS